MTKLLNGIRGFSSKRRDLHLDLERMTKSKASSFASCCYESDIFGASAFVEQLEITLLSVWCLVMLPL